MTQNATRNLAFVLLVVVALFSGCSNTKKMTEVYSTNIKKLHGSYMLYLENHGYVGPKDEAELKNYLKNDATAIYLLKRIDVTPESVDEMFISDRDGQPFVVRYGVRGEADHAVVFEAEGIDGMRLVALTNPTECDDDEYEGYLSGDIKPEKAPGAGGMTEDADEASQRSEEAEQ